MNNKEKQFRELTEEYYHNALIETGYELFGIDRKLQLSVMRSFAKYYADLKVGERNKRIGEWLNKYIITPLPENAIVVIYGWNYTIDKLKKFLHLKQASNEKQKLSEL